MKRNLLLFTLALFASSQIGAQSLQSRLDERAAQSDLPPEVKAKMAQHLTELTASDITSQARQVGEQAPDFTLNAHDGTPVTLTDFLAKGPVILTWYRGGW